jgi:hypothetical protein
MGFIVVASGVLNHAFQSSKRVPTTDAHNPASASAWFDARDFILAGAVISMSQRRYFLC